MKKILLIVTFFILFMSSVSKLNMDINKIDAEVIDTLNRYNTARVFVILKEPETIFGVNSLKSNRIVKDVIDKIGREKIKHEFSSFNGFSAEITMDELEKLIVDNRVKRIKKVGIKHLFLQQSAPLVNATRAWQIQFNGVNLTGRGETVCIIDSGVDYTHPDLGGCYGNNDPSSSCKVIGGWDFCADDNAICSGEDSDPMDIYGHGTHVAGIIAANGSIKGIAPEVKIIAMKVCNSNGMCSDDDIVSAIEWCTNNASKFNISVISISLGGGLFDTYCDSEESVYAQPINNATAHNISVIIATGNDGNYTHISSPACIENATAVAATYDKDYGSLNWYDENNQFVCSDEPANPDRIVCWSNRNNITDLVAPGAVINSTWLSGGYYETQGTSMSAPHVSAAFAILYQFGRLQGRNFTPSEIEQALKDTGSQVNDTDGNQLNYSRINIYSAILSLDETAPDITLVQPQDNLITIQRNLTFTCNVTDLQLKNITLQVWNSTGLYYENTTQINGTFNETSWNLTDFPYDDYKWNCFACDSQNNCRYADNFTLRITSLLVNISLPFNNTYTRQAGQNFTCNASSQSDELVNITFYLWNSTSLIYTETKNLSGLINGTIFNFTFAYEDRYKWNCLVTNNASYSDFAISNHTITYDVTAPNISIILPKNNSWYNALKFNITFSDILSPPDSCWFSMNNTNTTITKINDTHFYYFNATVNETDSPNGYNVTFYCNDTAGNSNSTILIFFGIDKSKPNVTLISPANGYSTTSTTLNFRFNVSDNLNISSCHLVINDNIVKTNNSINQSEINSITHTLSVGSYVWQINCTDEAGNYGNSTKRSLTISSSGNGGSSGGSFITSFAPKNKTTKLFYYANETKPITMDITVNSSLKKIILYVKNKTRNVKITFEKIETFDKKPIGDVYQYFKVESNINESKIKNITFEFEVEKIWLSNRSKEWVSMLHFYNNNRWIKLPTAIKNEDGSKVYYESHSDSLSYFAIVYKEEFETMLINETKKTKTENQTTCQNKVYAVKDGVCKEFLDCEVPEGWEIVDSCRNYDGLQIMQIIFITVLLVIVFCYEIFKRIVK